MAGVVAGLLLALRRASGIARSGRFDVCRASGGAPLAPGAVG